MCGGGWLPVGESRGAALAAAAAASMPGDSMGFGGGGGGTARGGGTTCPLTPTAGSGWVGGAWPPALLAALPMAATVAGVMTTDAALAFCFACSSASSALMLARLQGGKEKRVGRQWAVGVGGGERREGG